ncbi:MAG: Na+/H+ antiporter [Burkholderiales bacterium]|jgi:CPA1 family monovalent cation:H+ antiporter|nr:Na+/H+ antiporter [Burkholderiales bacterium]
MEALHIVLVVLAASVLLAVAAERLGIPYSVALVVGGTALALVPDLPPIRIDGEVLLALVLPATVFPAALFASWRAIRANVVTVASLAVGLVVATTVAVALAVRAIDPAIPVAIALLIGAIVAPPDASAALGILTRIGVRDRIRTILEGESLVNDPAALVLYQVTLAAVVAGTFMPGELAADFALDALGGVAIGAGVAWLASRLQARVSDTLVAATLSVLVAYGSYLLAAAADASGIIATVAAGVVRGRWWTAQSGTDVRMVDGPFWDVLAFVASSFVFALIGLELPSLVRGLGASFAQFALFAAAIIAVIGIVRFAWIVAGRALRRAIVRARDPHSADEPLDPAGVAVVGWSGMRGIVSVAAALALPHTLANGAPFPGRDAIIVVVAMVVFVTVVVPGLTLAPLARALGVADDPRILVERKRARAAICDAVETVLRAREAEGRIPHEAAQAVAALYRERAMLAEPEGAARWRATPRNLALAAAAEAARGALVSLYTNGEIGSTVMRELEREIDLEASRLRH